MGQPHPSIEEAGPTTMIGYRYDDGGTRRVRLQGPHRRLRRKGDRHPHRRFLLRYLPTHGRRDAPRRLRRFGQRLSAKAPPRTPPPLVRPHHPEPSQDVLRSASGQSRAWTQTDLTPRPGFSTATASSAPPNTSPRSSMKTCATPSTAESTTPAFTAAPPPSNGKRSRSGSWKPCAAAPPMFRNSTPPA